MKKLTEEEKYNNTVMLLGKEVADNILARNKKIEAKIIEKYGKLYKYTLMETQTNFSIKKGKEFDYYTVITCRGEFDVEIN